MRQNLELQCGGPIDILVVAFEDGRWGPARLIKPLQAAGFRVAALCPASNPLAHTRFLEHHFPLVDVRSSRHVETRLIEAMTEWRPKLVIPADERTVACLQALVRRARAAKGGRLRGEALAVLTRSLGDPAHFDAMMMKSQTLAAARAAGVRVPRGGTVQTPADAISWAETIGYPVYVKSSFGWNGMGVTRCENPGEVMMAMAARRPRSRMPFRALLRRLAHRDWYPTDTGIDVQQAIAGTPAMYSAVAVAGKMVAGFAGAARQTSAVNGPSSVAWIGAHAAMEQAAATMIEALGATGFIGFDFMIEAGTNEVSLLECNPRPTPTCHLGPRVGVDLCAALAAALRGRTATAARATGEAVVALFPQEWQRNPGGVADGDTSLDVPWDDPSLLRAMVSACADNAALAATRTRASDNRGLVVNMIGRLPRGKPAAATVPTLSMP